VHLRRDPRLHLDEVPDPVWEGEDPLPHRDARDDPVHEVGCGVLSAPRGARGAYAPSPAREADEDVVAAVLAADAGETMSQDPTRKVLSKLTLHEPGDALAMAALRPHLVQERMKVRLHHPVEQRSLGLVPPALPEQGGRGRTRAALIAWEWPGVASRPAQAAQAPACLAYAHAHKIGGLPVIDDDGRLVGMVTETDFLRVAHQALGGI
jgi:CBS domain-containing protein